MTDGSRLVAGRYRVGGLLGTGGSASVFAAVDERSGSGVALKILHPHLSQRPVARSAFLAEAARAEPLRHPNIVGVLGVGVDDTGAQPIAWIALERAAGSSLAEHVSRHGPLAPCEAVALADGILSALAAAHAMGLIHRDVSPANIMVARSESGAIDRDGVRLLDFGLADAAGATAVGTDDLLSVEATGRAGVLGNVNYISPEQVRGEPVDERGDIYQVGGVLYFALTGRPPFSRATTEQTLRAHLDALPPVPSAIDSRISHALDRTVVRAMLKNPDERFRSAADMRAAISAISGTATPVQSASAASAVVQHAADIDHLEVTRVLGATIVPPRVRAHADSLASSWIHEPRHARHRAGAVFALTTAAIVTGMIVAVALTIPRTASVESASTSIPAPAQLAAPVEEQTADAADDPLVEPVAVLVAVPDLGRHTLDEASRALADAGLQVGAVTYLDSASLRDTVLDSRPATGERVAEGGTVDLVVASGFTTVPNVAGSSPDDAWARVQSAGFAPSFGRQAVASSAQAGTIVGTDLTPGARWAVGTAITVLEGVFAGPTPSPTQTAPPVMPTPTLSPGAENDGG